MVYIGWNLDGGGGKTYFSNMRGGGPGAFVWRNYDISGNLTNEAMILDYDGNLTTIGNINGVSPTQLSYLDATSFNTNSIYLYSSALCVENGC